MIFSIVACYTVLFIQLDVCCPYGSHSSIKLKQSSFGSKRCHGSIHSILILYPNGRSKTKTSRHELHFPALHNQGKPRIDQCHDIGLWRSIFSLTVPQCYYIVVESTSHQMTNGACEKAISADVFTTTPQSCQPSLGTRPQQGTHLIQCFSFTFQSW